MSTARVRTGIDSWVNSAATATNYGTGIWLRMQAGTTTKRSFLYLKNPVPRTGTVLSATLRICGVGVWGTTPTVTVRRVATRWVESQINYNNQPGVTGATVTLTQSNTADATEWAFDVTSLIQTMADGAANYGFRITISDTAERRFYSLNATDHRPVLEVEWSDAPDAPTELSPSGGSAVTLSQPTLTFNFHDVSGSTAMQACQVQINPTNSFGAPAFDSGTVLSDDPQLDLTSTAYAGITVGSTAWWRVRVQDAAGLWGGWSDPTSFTRVARGTLTIASPSGGVVNDPTQTIIWSLSGATQTAWQVIVVDDSDPTRDLFNSRRRSGTATSFTLPKDIITSETTTYRLTVRVWDTPTRVATPGDLVHTEAVTTFVFAEGAPAAPSSVAVAQDVAGQPHVQLDIVIGAAPDSFTIVRDGRFIDTDVDPVDIFLSGTTYRYLDRSAEPSTPHIYKVRCKVGSALGPARVGSPSPFSYSMTELWLMDFSTPGSTHLVPIMVNLDNCQFDMPEISAVYTPVDGNAVVRVVQGQQGLTGHIEGRIMARAALPSAASVADMLWFKARPENQIRMTLRDQNLRVVIGNVVLSPARGPDSSARNVSFDFYSLDGPTQQ